MKRPAVAGRSPLNPMTKTSSETRVARILLVDDHPIVRDGLSQLIAGVSDLEVCGEAADGPEALHLIEQTSPDVVVTDISLEHGSGLELIKQVKALERDIKMLVWSMHEDSLYAERALQAGALGYINKEQPSAEVLQAIRQVLQGRIYVSPHMADRILRRAADGTQELDQPAVGDLSDRELEVFTLIGKGLTTRQIATKMYLSPKTIETHRENIKKKLKLKSGNELIRHAVQWDLEQH